MKMQRMICKIIAPLATASLLITVAGGCAKKDNEPAETGKEVVTIDSIAENEPVENADDNSATEPISETETETIPEPAPEEAETGRQDGERFEAVIVIEGMDETVKYEHVKNDVLGIEIDYDYENFVRQKDDAAERFISIYDNADAPENYLEIVHSEQDAETAVKSVGEELSKEYEIYQSDYTLDNAGECTRIDASADVGGKTMPEHLKMVYIDPATDGCMIATAHYTIESAEGFGRRFAYIMHTMTVK